ncbi:MAG: SCP2 sterol-binding domain-containing protein [Sulfuricaulis sp.]|uniref:SCP2 domain-containing protein n=1 Tax=Sulfuricaulis sp. TaxID=2003553 RepID=UPI0034A514D9
MNVSEQAYMPFPFTTLLEAALNRVLRLDPDTLARLGDLDGKVIRLRISGAMPFEIVVQPSKSGLRLHTRQDGEPDVTLTGDVPVFARFAMRRIMPEAVAAGDVRISGDIQLGQRFQQLMEKIDIDWEEQAAHILGDVTAHQLGNASRDLHGWSARAAQTLKDDFDEYIQEESRLLAPRLRAENFTKAVESLRSEVDRLERRVARLREIIR